MDEDWDNPPKEKSPEPPKPRFRGRGFIPACMRPDSPVVGRPPPPEEPKRNGRNECWDDDDDSEQGESKIDWDLYRVEREDPSPPARNPRDRRRDHWNADEGERRRDDRRRDHWDADKGERRGDDRRRNHWDADKGERRGDDRRRDHWDADKGERRGDDRRRNHWDADKGERRGDDRRRNHWDADEGERRGDDRRRNHWDADEGERRGDDRRRNHWNADEGERRGDDRRRNHWNADKGERRGDDRRRDHWDADEGERRGDDRRRNHWNADENERRGDDRRRNHWDGDDGERRRDDRRRDHWDGDDGERRRDDRRRDHWDGDDGERKRDDRRRDHWDADEGERRRDDRRRGRNDKQRRSMDEEPDQSKPKPSLYIPKKPTEDEEEIFSSGISCGINFDKYDDIEVKVSGSEPVDPITHFEEAGLKSILMGLIKKCNYTKPTPVQKYAIPAIMSGRDLMACAQTGSGKTAAYLIPIMNQLLDDSNNNLGPEYICKPQALVMAPTRELTIQIFNEARKFSRGSVLRVEFAYGGTSINHQIQVLTRKGCDFLVATPGRLLDLIRRGKILFSRLRFVILDEADRMLDLGFLADMENVMEHISEETTFDRQTLMFSATFPEEVQILAAKFLNHYLFIAVGIVGGACRDIEQKVYAVTKYEKRNKLVDLLVELKNSKILVFVEQKRTTDVLATFLSEKNFRATSIHGGREQKEREEALDDFKSGHMKILVATSVAARGLDIKNVAHVINYDLPKNIDEYVHRIGRTGRVGNKGSAISFYDENVDCALASDLAKIIKESGQEVPPFLCDEHEKRSSANGGNCSNDNEFGGEDVRDLDAPEPKPSNEQEEYW